MKSVFDGLCLRTVPTVGAIKIKKARSLKADPVNLCVDFFEEPPDDDAGGGGEDDLGRELGIGEAV